MEVFFRAQEYNQCYKEEAMNIIAQTSRIFCLLIMITACDTAVNKNVELELIGSVKPTNANEIESSNWIIGCETLDRDYANYDAYKEYLVPLGIKRIRLQGGWAKTEKEKGKYDWTWLDHIINDAVSKGLDPWVQLSYGNNIYEGGGGINLAGGIPISDEALLAWDKWVLTMVNRYKDKVGDWEIWNEPNFGDNKMNTAEITADFNIRTVDIIKKEQPEARVSGLAMGHIDLSFADEFFKILSANQKLHLFDNMVYHDYVYNPDSNYDKVIKLREILHSYGNTLPLRQGENGAPSEGGPGRGAIGDYNWNELSQAKWDTRRMLGDLGHDIESSVFTIIDIAYTAGPITKLNVKGLIESDSTKNAIRPKIAYNAVQNVASIFDNSLIRIKEIEEKKGAVDTLKSPIVRYQKSIPDGISFFGYEHRETKKQIFTIWKHDSIPNNSSDKESVDFTISNINIENPVYVDVITGNVYSIPSSMWVKKEKEYTFKSLPIYDAPILIADKSLIKFDSIN